MDGSYTGTAGDAKPDAAEAITLAFTIVKSEQPLTKRYKLGENKAPERTGSGAFYAGEARRVEVTGACARALLAAVAKRIGALAATEALIAAPPPEGRDEWRVVTKDKANRTQGTVARRKEDFAAPAGRCILMLDCDTKTYPDEIKERLDAQGGLWSVLKSVCPALGEAACFSRPSASSNITVDLTGDTTGPAGEHLYLIATDGRDVHSFAKRLHGRLLLEGWGWFYLTAAGSVRSRSLIDPAASSPDRIVYEADADLSEGLSQAPRAVTPLSRGAGAAFLDTSRLPELSQEEEDRLEEIEARWREENAEKIAAAQAAQVEKRVTDRAAGGVDEGYARQAVESAIRDGVLEGEWPIELDTGDTVTVAEILAEPAKYHGQTCADPLEPEYGGGRNLAVIYTDGPRPIIYSHAHGGTSYLLLDPGHWFQPVGPEMQLPWLTAIRDADSLANIPRREFIIFPRFPRGDVAQCIGEPGISKSAFALRDALTVASGEPDRLGLRRPEELHADGPVIVYNAEDSSDEMRRRLKAACTFYGLPAEQKHPIYLWSGVDSGALNILDREGERSGLKPSAGFQRLRETIKRTGAVLVYLDPQVSLAAGINENSSEDMDALFQALAELASETGAAICVIHHTAKHTRDAKGDMGAGRGSFAAVAKVRSAFTLVNVKGESGDEKDWGVSAEAGLVRLDYAKLSHSQEPRTPTLFRRASAYVGNGTASAPIGPAGEFFGLHPRERLERDGDTAPVLEPVRVEDLIAAKALREPGEAAERARKLAEIIFHVLGDANIAYVKDVVKDLGAALKEAGLATSGSRDAVDRCLGPLAVGGGVVCVRNGRAGKLRLVDGKGGSGGKPPKVIEWVSDALSAPDVEAPHAG